MISSRLGTVPVIPLFLHHLLSLLLRPTAIKTPLQVPLPPPLLPPPLLEFKKMKVTQTTTSSSTSACPHPTPDIDSKHALDEDHIIVRTSTVVYQSIITARLFRTVVILEIIRPEKSSTLITMGEYLLLTKTRRARWMMMQKSMEEMSREY